MLELLPNLLLATLAVFGVGRVFGRQRGGTGVDLLISEGFCGLAGMVLLATLAGLLNIVVPISVFNIWVILPFAGLGAWVLVRKTTLEFCLSFFGSS